MNYREEVRNGKLYLKLNEILKDQLPKIKANLSKDLEAFFKEKKLVKPFDVICQLEIHPWGQATQWRIEIDFDDYEWSPITMKPHHLGAIVMLEEVAGKKTLHFSFKIHNSFNPKPKKSHHETINTSQLFNNEFIKLKINAVETFLENLKNGLMTEVEKVELNQLELLEDDK